jgi:hypothetical protein
VLGGGLQIKLKIKPGPENINYNDDVYYNKNHFNHTQKNGNFTYQDINLGKIRLFFSSKFDTQKDLKIEIDKWFLYMKKKHFIVSVKCGGLADDVNDENSNNYDIHDYSNSNDNNDNYNVYYNSSSVDRNGVGRAKIYKNTNKFENTIVLSTINAEISYEMGVLTDNNLKSNFYNPYDDYYAGFSRSGVDISINYIWKLVKPDLEGM